MSNNPIIFFEIYEKISENIFEILYDFEKDEYEIDLLYEINEDSQSFSFEETEIELDSRIKSIILFDKNSKLDYFNIILTSVKEKMFLKKREINLFFLYLMKELLENLLNNKSIYKISKDNFCIIQKKRGYLKRIIKLHKNLFYRNQKPEIKILSLKKYLKLKITIF